MSTLKPYPNPSAHIVCPNTPHQDAHRQRTVNWVDSTGGTNAAFDFTTKGILQEALGRTELWRLVDAQVVGGGGCQVVDL